MPDDEVMQLKDGDRVVVRYRGHAIPGAVSDQPWRYEDGDASVMVNLDGGLGENGEAVPYEVYAEDVLRRAEAGEGLVRIGDRFYRQADTIFADEP